jgi:hypothetical protein
LEPAFEPPDDAVDDRVPDMRPFRVEEPDVRRAAPAFLLPPSVASPTGTDGTTVTVGGVGVGAGRRRDLRRATSRAMQMHRTTRMSGMRMSTRRFVGSSPSPSSSVPIRFGFSVMSVASVPVPVAEVSAVGEVGDDPAVVEAGRVVFVSLPVRSSTVGAGVGTGLGGAVGVRVG